jgi:FixJ family two-component response regulator
MNPSRPQGEDVPRSPSVIAIVDDDASLRRALARLLRVMGYQTVTFASAEAFLQAGLHESLACLLLDVWLSGISGVALLERLASLNSTLPVILITGRDDVQIYLRAVQMGAIAYPRKPLDEQELEQALQRVLEQKLSECWMNARRIPQGSFPSSVSVRPKCSSTRPTSTTSTWGASELPCKR